jgi:UDP-glucose 4-epimerase
MRVTVLRYFNPIGAHPSGLIGEAPNGIPNNLAPYITQVAVGVRPEVAVFGNDYPTRDGTGERDYVHVMDLADGHVAAVEQAKQGFVSINLGTGRGTTVLELIAAFSRAVGRDIPYRIAPPRPGDQAVSYAAPGKAEAVLGWSATRSIDEAAADSWRWQEGNPLGYSAA